MIDSQAPVPADEQDATQEMQALLQRRRLIEIRVQIDQFLSSPAGQYLLERAAQERQDALNALAEANPTDTERIRELQSNVKRVDSFEAWLNDAIAQGDDAIADEARAQERD